MDEELEDELNDKGNFPLVPITRRDPLDSWERTTKRAIEISNFPLTPKDYQKIFLRAIDINSHRILKYLAFDRCSTNLFLELFQDEKNYQKIINNIKNNNFQQQRRCLNLLIEIGFEFTEDDLKLILEIFTSRFNLKLFEFDFLISIGAKINCEKSKIIFKEFIWGKQPKLAIKFIRELVKRGLNFNDENYSSIFFFFKFYFNFLNFI